ncbi:MAG: EamA family transporter [Chthoniobacterales bacterium]|nr:EamA family transporter [Chthoniobacterales bacterium]
MPSSTSAWWIYALLAAFFAALTTIFAKVGVQNVNSNLATAVRTIVVLLVAWGIVIARGEFTGWASLSTRTLTFLILSGLATGLSWIFYFKALQAGKASLVAPIDKLSLVMILLFSVQFLGEPLTWQVLVGGTLIVIGTFVLVL